jgi:hypothetical protein
VTLPGADNQTIRTVYSGATSTSGATIVVTDTVGRIRKTEVDGLGRLAKVIEQNPANGNLEWETSYSYDILNNLTQINQGGPLSRGRSLTTTPTSTPSANARTREAW